MHFRKKKKEDKFSWIRLEGRKKVCFNKINENEMNKFWGKKEGVK